jgi:methylated-DNA-protein-cysteine methyltransferase-like protein
MVNLVPFGKVVSYGQVALYIGVPRAARQVGWTLNRLGGKVDMPWWRVVSSKGRISIKNSKYSVYDQKSLLEKEGIEISNDLSFDIEKYRFIPKESVFEEFELDSSYLNLVSESVKYSKYFPCE